MEDVRFQVMEELRDVRGGAMVAGEHVLCMPRIPLSPCLIVQLVHHAAAVVALIEAHGYETQRILARAVLGNACVPGTDDLGRQGSHGLFGLETWVQEPETGYGGGGREELR